MNTSLNNVLSVFHQADSIDLREGMTAYERYHHTMLQIANHYGIDVASVTGAFCALSPNNDYVGNLRSLVSCIVGIRDGISEQRITVSTYNACKARALRCLNGEDFLSFTKGPKTRAFYSNIVSPEALDHVTIDGHMVSVWLGRRLTMKKAIESRFNYSKIAQDFRQAAFTLCVRPNQVQAVCWFVWKRIHRVLYNPQLNILLGEDQWGLLPEPSAIRPYRAKDSHIATSSAILHSSNSSLLTSNLFQQVSLWDS
jgi:hypothetical protein